MPRKDRKDRITVLGYTLTRIMPDGYDADQNGYPRGMVCKSTTTGKWAATWNMVPAEGDSHYKYASIEAAVQRLIDWENEAREKEAALQRHG